MLRTPCGGVNPIENKRGRSRTERPFSIGSCQVRLPVQLLTHQLGAKKIALAANSRPQAIHLLLAAHLRLHRLTNGRPLGFPPVTTKPPAPAAPAAPATASRRMPNGNSPKARPTKTPSAPSCIISAASDGVAIPRPSLPSPHPSDRERQPQSGHNVLHIGTTRTKKLSMAVP